MPPRSSRSARISGGADGEVDAARRAPREDAGIGRVIEFPQKPTTRQVEHAGIDAERAVRLAIMLYRAKHGCSLADAGPVADSPVSRTPLLDYGASGMAPRA
jgi:hypothetical protein